MRSGGANLDHGGVRTTPRCRSAPTGERWPADSGRPAPVGAGPLGQPGLDGELAGDRRAPDRPPPWSSRCTPLWEGATRNSLAAMPCSSEWAWAPSTSSPWMRQHARHPAEEPGPVGRHGGHPVAARPARRCGARPMSSVTSSPTGTATSGLAAAPAAQHVAHPVDQLLDELGLPRAPRRWAGGHRVGFGERGQQLQHQLVCRPPRRRAVMVASSVRSRRVATSGSRRWWRTSASSTSTSSGARPIRWPMRSTSSTPTTEWSPG